MLKKKKEEKNCRPHHKTREKAQIFLYFVLFLSGSSYSFKVISSLVLVTDIFNSTVKLVNLQFLRLYFWDKYSCWYESWL